MRFKDQALAYLAVLALLGFVLIVAACHSSPDASAPMGKIDFLSQGKEHKLLIVFLPGRSGRPDDFEKEGMVEAARAKYPAADIEAVRAHVGYYEKRTLVPRLFEEVLSPAKHMGYSEIWIVGTSMGGFGALLYAQKHAGTITGVFLLAPYLGDKEVIQEIRAAGGLKSWVPSGSLRPDDNQRSLWVWVKNTPDLGNGAPKIYMGFGTEDPMGEADQLLADVLPKDHVFNAPGGHSWSSWLPLWRMFLDKGIIQGQ